MARRLGNEREPETGRKPRGPLADPVPQAAEEYAVTYPCGQPRPREFRGGLTLVEVLTAVGIVALFLTVLLRGIQATREGAKRLECQYNLGQLGIALSQYHSAFHTLPPGCVAPTGPVSNAPTGYKMGWIVQLLPMIEQGALYREIDFAHGPFALENREVYYYHLQRVTCPSSNLLGVTSYVGVHASREMPIDAENDGVLFLNSSVQHDDIDDGLAFTMFVGETSEVEYGWMPGTRASLRNAGHPLAVRQKARYRRALRLPPEAPVRSDDISVEVGSFSGNHDVAGANALFGDGHVHFLSVGLEHRILQHYCARADGCLPPEPGL